MQLEQQNEQQTIRTLIMEQRMMFKAGLVIVILFIHGCANRNNQTATICPQQPEGNIVKQLIVKWERLVSGGKTCPRCGSTEGEIDKAIKKLEQSLNPLGISVLLEKHEISEANFKADPLKSNQISINNKPIEEWLGGETGQSQCCDVCGTSECRTINVDNTTYETIKSELIIKAGLIAAASLKDPDPMKPCCEKPPPKKCCPR